MSELVKAYESKDIEARWYQTWLDRKAFAGRVEEGKQPFAIMIPPPNVTGMLHMGHILNNTLQDIFIRRARLEGKAAVWFPGTDHAGIATQTMVEKKLRTEQGVSRRDLGREKFLGHVWEWKEKHGGIILNQLRQLGASCDWDRTTFTLDEGYAKAVLTAFVKLHERGLIYRGRRMVNWCPVSMTALSDEEVIPTAQQGFLYRMRYELCEPTVDHEGNPLTHLEICTTRPETIMGDTAVAVHPEDDRYRHLVGKTVYRPFPKAPITIIADDHVDRAFGTGVLKVTPAHDAADFAIGQRHHLPVIDVLNADGTISAAAGMFVGMDRFAARKAASAELDRLGQLIEAKPYENNVGFSERAKVPVEPRLSEQWFLKYPRVEEAKRVVSEGLVTFHPPHWSKIYLHWLGNIQDWCISRQLWWGHRIPVWYRKGADRNDPANQHVSVDGPSDPQNWDQEEDVLDTWASSWLWPFACWGWPDAQGEAKRELEFFYPTGVLVTGFDIIFFWVARMIMAGLELTGDQSVNSAAELPIEELRKRIPFKDVYITGLIRDALGRKMSKTLGNSPDPLDLIAKFGADGLRFGIVNIAPSGQDIKFDEKRVEIGKHFCNKLWNACRFRQMSGPAGDNRSPAAILARLSPAHLDAYDHWMLARLVELHRDAEKCFAEFDMPNYTNSLYQFFWNDFCAWYVEAAKSKVQASPAQRDHCLALQDLVLRQFLLLQHPVQPFITEELWEKLGYAANFGDLLQQTRLETAAELTASLAALGLAPDPAARARVAAVNDFVTVARTLKAQFNLGSKRDSILSVTCDDASWAILSGDLAETLRRLAGCSQVNRAATQPDGAPAAVSPLGTIYLDLAGAIDTAAEKTRLTKEIERLAKIVTAGEAKLSNEKFVATAPANIVEGARAQLNEAKAKLDENKRLLAGLS